MTSSMFLMAAWRNLIMLNYRIDPAVLEPLVPKGTELDAWDGHGFACVSMVGFLFLETKVLGVPVPFHRNFEEVNLRFYVRRVVNGEVRRGVVFVKEIVPRHAIAAVARLLYNENYVAMPMRHTIDHAAEENRTSIEYGWKHGSRWNSMRISVAGKPTPLQTDCEEEFITEHFWGYARQRNGGTVEYQVEHPRWRVWKALDASLDCDVEELYGAPFVEALSAPPVSAFLAEGSDIIVRKGMMM